MTEAPSSMHGGATSAPPPTCDACLTVFKPKKRWQRFCSPRCRNDWHQWTKSVREARELVRLALDGPGSLTEWEGRARKLLGIKPTPTHPVVREVAATLAAINAAADRRDEVVGK